MRITARTEAAAWALLAYVPFFLSSPGRVSADSKQYLYLDPGAFLGRAADLWDPAVGAGGVPHQHLGYLFPVGPFYWALDQLAVPDWVAQRLWLGTVSLVAALGTRRLLRQLGLGRPASVVGALVYAATPYQLAFTARISVLLLPWAALPWLVALSMRATRTEGWRAPLLVGVVLLLAGGINASSLILVAIAPALWVLFELVGPHRRAALRAVGRIAVVAVGVSLWWLVGLRVQGAYGLPVLQLTENLETVAAASTPGDVLRGLGNWFFYGRDRIGYSIDQAHAYAEQDLVVAVTYALPAFGLVAALVVRWAHRTYFALLIVVGVVVSVGSWPFDDPSPYGRAWRSFTEETSFGLAFRNSPRAVPLVVLGLAGLLAALVEAAPAIAWRRGVAGAAAAVALAGMLPVAVHGYLTDFLTRPEDLPPHWDETGALLDAGDHGTRILEIPGMPFAAYSWGTTVEPVTPGLTARPYVAREVLPLGTPPSANLVAALDRRIQLGVFEAASLVPVARLLGVGTVALRADLDQSGRFGNPPVEPLWRSLTGAPIEGLDAPRSLGPTTVAPSGGEVPAVALFDVRDPQPIVRTHATAAPLVVAGDGDGLVDSAAAGLLDGDPLVRYAADLDDAELDAALEDGARLVLTDSNRRRIETWFYSIRDTRGPTERTGRTAPDPTGYDFRLDPFTGATDDDRTVVEQVGGTVEATSEGGPDRPEDRAAAAVDGDAMTAWRVAGPDPRGQAVTLTPSRAVDATEVRIRLAAGTRAVTRVRLVLDGEETIDVDLAQGASSGSGQAVPLGGRRSVRSLEVVILDTAPAAPSPQDVSPVGIAEIELADVRVDEVVRLPVDLLGRVGERLTDHPLAVVLTRLRLDLPGTDRRDEERRLDRRFELPVAQRLELAGAARPFDGSTITPSSQCRSDLLAVDGRPIPLRVGPASSAGEHPLEGCGPIELGPGSHRVTAGAGVETGVDLDRLVLTTPEAGPRTVTGASPPVEVRTDDPDRMEATVRSDGAPFWFVLGQSASSGWEARVDGGELGDRQTVDGYANGWRVTPDGPGPVTIDLVWPPQRTVRWGIALSAVATSVVVGALIVGRRRIPRTRPALVARPRLLTAGDTAPLGLARSGAVGVATAALGAVIAPLDVALAAGLVALVACGSRWGRWVLVVAAPAALALSRGTDRPSLAWLAVLLLVADLLAGGLRRVNPGV